jgi:hypothetical protein
VIEKLKSINKSTACQRDLLAMGLIHGADLWRWDLPVINRPSATDEEIRLIHFS